MSLEQELARNTAAMTALTAALRQYLDAPVTAAEIDRFITSGVPDSDIPVRKISVVTGAEWAALQEKEVPKPVAASSAPAATPDTPTATVTPVVTPASTLTIEYPQVAKAITDVFKVDRAKVVAALAKFGAAKGPQLKAEDYSAFLTELGA